MMKIFLDVYVVVLDLIFFIKSYYNFILIFRFFNIFQVVVNFLIILDIHPKTLS